jgi:PBP1b-binding outer membrane lipoprotein LpoB
MRTVLMGLLGMTLVMSGCGPKRARTISVEERARLEGTGLEARDMRAVATQMATALLATPEIAMAATAPRIAVMPVKNRSRFLIDQEILNTLLTDQIVQTANGKVRILNRELTGQIVAERAAQSAGTVTGGATGARSGADYFLEGEIRGLSESTSRLTADYLVVRFQLTDAGTSEIAWSNTYEVKKEGSWGLTYQ